MKTSQCCFLIDDDVDDQQIFMEVAKQITPELSCIVENDAEKALVSLRAANSLPNLIFLDVNMPKMDGFEFLISLKRDQRLKYIPVIFYSTTSDKSQIKRATALGADGFIIKTNSYDELSDVLEPVLRKYFDTRDR